jgi:hypothetical protein
LGFAILVALLCVIAFGIISRRPAGHETQEIVQFVPTFPNKPTETHTPTRKGILPSNVPPATQIVPPASPNNGPVPTQPHLGSKQRALELSRDMLSFVGERKTTEPSNLSFTARTKEEQDKQLSQFNQEYQHWMRETGNQYRLRFAGRITAVLQDTKAAGIDLGGGESNCATAAGAGASGNLAVIETCGANIGAIGERLPQ